MGSPSASVGLRGVKRPTKPRLQDEVSSGSFEWNLGAEICLNLSREEGQSQPWDDPDCLNLWEAI